MEKITDRKNNRKMDDRQMDKITDRWTDRQMLVAIIKW
jgi:hypothetical protein